MKRNFIINLITFLVTSFLLVLIVMAWYVSNQEVRASGITARTADENFTLELERGTYNNGTWTWTPTKSLSITNMQPDDAFFFRFKITVQNSGTLRVKLSGITSQVVEDVVTLGTDDKSVLIAGTKYFELTGSSVVIKNGETTLGTLYNYSNGEFTLDDFLVQDSFDFYDYGIGTENFYKTGTTYYTDDVAECPNPVQDLTDISTTYTNLPASSIQYGYFALEFDEVKSLKTYTHIDGLSKTDSNLFQAQSLAIQSISVETVLS